MCFWLTDANNTERAFTLIMTEYEYQDHRPQRCPPQQDRSVQTHRRHTCPNITTYADSVWKLNTEALV